jgi:hypothetical protein
MTQATIKVYGVKAALKELNKINPSLRRQFTKRYKDIVKPVLNQAKMDYPQDAPLSGMITPYKKLGGWNGGLVARGVQAKIDTRKGRKEVVAAFLIQQKTGWGSIYDIAGRTNPNSNFARNLTTASGRGASRALWPAYEANASKVQDAVVELVGDVMAEVNRNLVFSGN